MDSSSKFSRYMSWLCVVISLLVLSISATNVSHDGRAIIIDGKHRVLFSGSIHYPRSTAEMWPDLIKKAREGGLDAVETYVFWNAHEHVRRQYDFSGNLDLVRFLKTIQDEGLYAVLRIGPYVCAEWKYGGFPVWLHNLPGVELRTVNDVYMNEMRNFTTLIVDMMKQNSLFASQGGPIILAQIENEYGDVQWGYGAAAKPYIDWCANLAESLDIGVPWIMCQQADAPKPIINTCNGFYCDHFTPNDPSSPKIWTENWVSSFTSWGSGHPHRTAEDLAFAVARFFQFGGTLNNYYMYHGGTNFGRTSGGPYITTTYDYDAPLDEYGNLNQPKYGHLKQLHDVLHSVEVPLTQGNVSTTDLGNSVSATIYATGNVSCCFLSNINSTSDATIDFHGKNYTIPAWSVSVLPNCDHEAYNTAKVNVQTSVMVKNSSNADKQPLKWSWRPENLDQTVVLGKGDVSTHRIVGQKAMADDKSDYLWYMTSLELSKDDPVLSHNMSLRVNGTAGHVLHVYVNGHYLDSVWEQYRTSNYVFEKKVNLNPGRNLISLLSATDGFRNYGSHFDTIPSGIVDPVEIVGRKGDETIIKNLSKHKWNYKVGLEGFDNQLFSVNSSARWVEENLPINRTMTWYKATFKAPLGTDTVALDMQGMGKGAAWVNGNNIGRYWPAYLAPEDACSTGPCDYRGSYNDKKCLSGCGKPTQRWYHVPRSFFKDGENTLVLFEEFGGNPSSVNFQTITTGSICANAYENSTLELNCQGKPISAIKFASFGDPQGTCGSFVKGSCQGTNDSLTILQNKCVGKEKCSVEVSEATFGTTKCDISSKRLAVEAVC